MRKGIILAGGSGTRLHPLTLVDLEAAVAGLRQADDLLSPVDLMLAGIREILIITTPHDQAGVQASSRRPAGNGALQLEYAVQPSPGRAGAGLPHRARISSTAILHA